MNIRTALIPLLLASGMTLATMPARAGDDRISIRLVAGDLHPVHYRHDYGYCYKRHNRHHKWHRHYRQHHRHHKRHHRHYREHARHHDRHHDRFDDHRGHGHHDRHNHDSHSHRNRHDRVKRSRIGIGYTGRL